MPTPDPPPLLPEEGGNDPQCPHDWRGPFDWRGQPWIECKLCGWSLRYEAAHDD